MKKFWGNSLFCIALSLLTSLSACGGGTRGTGTGEDELRQYQGEVVASTSGEPIPNATVTLVETGDATTTDAAGNFALSSNQSMDSVTFLVESGDFSGTFRVDSVSPQASAVSLRVAVDMEDGSIEATDISSRVGIIGACDYYFENRNVIRQANPIAPGTSCTLAIKVLGDGKPLGDVPFVLQVRSCRAGAIWETVAAAKTGVGIYRGTGEISFRYFDSFRTCMYRVLVPFGVQGQTSSEHLIRSLTAQRLDVEN